jgi:uncharacterized membrane protein
MERQPHKDFLDRTFQVGIVLKGLDGVLELVGGVALLVTSPETINRIAFALTRQELSADPHDFIANHILRTARGLTGASVVFGAVYLITHGAAKVVLVGALFAGRLWAYPWMIAFLVAFIVYQLYRIAIRPTAGMVLLTVFDVFVVWLTLREYGKQRALARSP